MSSFGKAIMHALWFPMAIFFTMLSPVMLLVCIVAEIAVEFKLCLGNIGRGILEDIRTCALTIKSIWRK